MNFGCDKPGTKLKLESFCMKPVEFMSIPNQPKRSKREDSCEYGDHDWMHIPLGDDVSCRRCGALNIVETQ